MVTSVKGQVSGFLLHDFDCYAAKKPTGMEHDFDCYSLCYSYHNNLYTKVNITDFWSVDRYSNMFK